MMNYITDSEKEVLKEWVPGIDLSKVKIRTGRLSEIFCAVLGASAVAIGQTIWARKKSWICRYPEGHPLRLASLVHELYHIKQEKAWTKAGFLLTYNFISTVLLVPFFLYLCFRVVFATAKWLIREHSHLSHHLHPFERSAEKLEKKFLNKHWTEEEAKKWGWKPENEK